MILILSCQKEEDDTSSPGIVTEFCTSKYMPLNVGNYWVYEHFLIDSLGNETSMEKFDSMAITRDSIIGDKKYFVLEGTNYPYKSSQEWGIIDILRDSIGYLVNQDGVIRFSRYNFTDTLAIKFGTSEDDTCYVIYCKMEKCDHPVTVPAGSFEVLNFRGELYNHVLDTPKIDERYMNNYYAKDVGKIVQTWYLLSQTGFFSERRLIRYSIHEENI